MNVFLPLRQPDLFENAFLENQDVNNNSFTFNIPATRTMTYDPKLDIVPIAGIKYDSKKPRPSLLPFDSIDEILKVLEYGAQKYAPDNWKQVVPRSRYIDATLRHLIAWQKGEDVDDETNISHLAHAATNILFLIHFELQGENPRESN